MTYVELLKIHFQIPTAKSEKEWAYKIARYDETLLLSEIFKAWGNSPNVSIVSIESGQPDGAEHFTGWMPSLMPHRVYGRYFFSLRPKRKTSAAI